MMFTITIQDPFKAQPDNYGLCDATRAQELFKSIDWAALWKEMGASGDSPESPFYFYEIKKKNTIGEDESLVISGAIGVDTCVGYFRPKMIIKRGFFKQREVMEPKFQTQMDDVPVAFGPQCLDAFIAGDNYFLENEIYDKRGYSSF